MNIMKNILQGDHRCKSETNYEGVTKFNPSWNTAASCNQLLMPQIDILQCFSCQHNISKTKPHCVLFCFVFQKEEKLNRKSKILAISGFIMVMIVQ